MVEFFDTWSPWQARELAKRGLTPLQERFCKAMTMEAANDPTKAAEIANPSSDYPSSEQARLRKLPVVRKRLDEIAEEVGLTPKMSLETIRDQHKATKPFSVGKGEVIQVPDNAAQREAAVVGLRIHGLASASGAGGSGQTINVNILNAANWDEIVEKYHNKKGKP